MATKFQTLKNISDVQWQLSVYKKIQLESGLPQLECANQCLNFEGGKCNWFVQTNLTCFLGNSAPRSGSINSNLTSNVLFVSTGKSVIYFNPRVELISV